MKSRLLSLLFVGLLTLSACSFDFNAGDTSTSTDSDTTSSNSTSSISGSQVTYSVNYDPDKWLVIPAGAGEDIEYDFEHLEGDVYAMIIPERTELSFTAIKEAALDNALAVAPDMEIVYEDRITVNGVEVMALKMVGTIYDIEFYYYGYYYTGSAGTIQFITYTTSDLFDAYESDLTELLDGLVVTE